MSNRDGNDPDDHPGTEGTLPWDLLVGLTRCEPDWRSIVLDHADHRPGGYLVGGSPEKLICANFHAAAEVGLLGNEIYAFLAREGPGPALSLSELRRVRADYASGHVLRRLAGTAPELREYHAEAEVAGAQAAGDEAIEPALRLLSSLLASLPAPWLLTRVVRNPNSGSLWAFGLNQARDLAVAWDDLEARRMGTPPSALWLPANAQLDLLDFLTEQPDRDMPPDDESLLRLVGLN